MRLLPFLNRNGRFYLLNMLISFGVALTGPCMVAVPDHINIFQLVPVGFSVLYGFIYELVCCRAGRASLCLK